MLSAGQGLAKAKALESLCPLHFFVYFELSAIQCWIVFFIWCINWILLYKKAIRILSDSFFKGYYLFAISLTALTIWYTFTGGASGGTSQPGIIMKRAKFFHCHHLYKKI